MSSIYGYDFESDFWKAIKIIFNLFFLLVRGVVFIIGGLVAFLLNTLSTSGGSKGKRKKIEEQDKRNLENFLHLGRRISIPHEVRAKHMYVVGKTGSGKSKAMLYWLSQDIDAGRGCAFIDPHGDVIEDCLSMYAARMRAMTPHLDMSKNPLLKRLVIIDLTDKEYAVGINPLQKYGPYDAMDMGELLEEAVKKVWGFELKDAPLMGQILRFSGYVLSENNKTLADMGGFLRSPQVRAEMLKNTDNEEVRAFWEEDYPNAVARDPSLYHSAMRRASRFTANEKVLAILGQRKSTLKIREAMDNNCVILCKIPSTVGEMGSFFGALLVSQFQQAAMSRSQDERSPFYLYIDEFQNFVSGAFPKILAEMRKYGLHFILSHQYKRQVDEEIQNAIFGNVNTMLAFRVGAEDGVKLGREFFTLTGQMMRDARRSFRIMNIGGLQIPTIEETGEYFSVNEEAEMNANAFTKLDPRQFLVMYEGLDEPIGDLTEHMMGGGMKQDIERMKEICGRRWGNRREEVLNKIKQSAKAARRQGGHHKKPYAKAKKKTTAKTSARKS